MNSFDLAERARQIVVNAGLSLKNYRTDGSTSTGKITIQTEHGTTTFQFVVGLLSANEYLEVFPEEVFSLPVQEAIAVVEKLGFRTRLAKFYNTEHPATLMWETVLLADDDREAVLSLALKDHHYDRVLAAKYLAKDRIADIHARLAELRAALDAKQGEIKSNREAAIALIYFITETIDSIAPRDISAVWSGSFTNSSVNGYPVVSVSARHRDTHGYLATWTIDASGNHPPMVITQEQITEAIYDGLQRIKV